MKTLLTALLLTPLTLNAATTLEWDHQGDPRITHFQLDENETEHYIINDPAARSVPMEMAGMSYGNEYRLRACSESACSEPSNALYLPHAPSSIRLVIEW